ncbi:hypothetical protein AB0C28_12155 [Nonomuraea sp. NPDC048892]|uniref:WD40 repeat domain-containing protein n=1 Tax=Nonomuraea sp. NPDC048892 TaxID=3154624 RepID=UPI0033E19D9A
MPPADAPPRCPVCLTTAAGEPPDCRTCGWTLYGPPVLGRLTAADEREFTERLTTGQRAHDLLAATRAAHLGSGLEALVRAGPVQMEERRTAEQDVARELAALDLTDADPHQAAEQAGAAGEVVVVEIAEERITAARFALTSEAGPVESAELRVVEWRSLVPDLSGDPVERAFTLAGGIGVRPVTYLTETFAPTLSGLATRDDQVTVINRLPGWPLADAVAETMRHHHPGSRLLLARPPTTREPPPNLSEMVRVRGGITAGAAGVLRDGRAFVAAGGADGSVTAWALPGAVRLSLDSRHTARVTAVDLNDDLVVSGDGRGVVLCRRLRGDDTEPRPLVAHLDRVIAVHAGDTAVFSLDGTGALWRTPTDSGGDAFHVDVTIAAASALAVTGDGTIVATGGTDGTIRLWDGHTGDRIRAIKAAGRITALAFAPDGRTLAIGQVDGTVARCDLTAGHVTALPVASPTTGRPIRTVALRDDGVIVTGDDTGLIRCHPWAGTGPAVGTASAVGAGSVGSGSVAGAGFAVGTHAPAAVKAVASHADRLLSAGADGLVRLWARDFTRSSGRSGQA